VAKQFAGRAQAARAVLVNGSVGVVVAPRGRLLLVLALRITHGKIAEINVIAEPARLQKLDLALLGD
jgi:RNA polymerase sigma-70 factor (ECF subfamily)